LILNMKIDLSHYKTLIVLEIDNISNKVQFLQKLSGIKVIATSTIEYPDVQNNFAVKIQVEPFSKRSEDLDVLVQYYVEEASNIYQVEVDLDNIVVDISQNAISLKKSIYKSVFLNSMTKDDITKVLYSFFKKPFETKGFTYKDFLEIFEVPLLKAAKDILKSQVQMAKILDINRITLRKKIATYFGDKNV